MCSFSVCSYCGGMGVTRGGDLSLSLTKSDSDMREVWGCHCNSFEKAGYLAVSDFGIFQSLTSNKHSPIEGQNCLSLY